MRQLLGFLFFVFLFFCWFQVNNADIGLRTNVASLLRSLELIDVSQATADVFMKAVPGSQCVEYCKEHNIDFSRPVSIPAGRLEQELSRIRGIDARLEEPLYLANFTTEQETRTCNYICRLNSVVIDEDGRVCSQSDNFCLKQSDCQSGTAAAILSNQHLDYYEKVFIISQYWGYGFFHFLLEDLIRISDALPELLNDTSVYVHVRQKNSYTINMLKYIGIQPSRIVSGNIKAGAVIYPQSTQCGRPSAYSLHRLKETLEKSACFQGLSNGSPLSSNTGLILVVSRTGARSLNNEKELVSGLENNFGRLGYTVQTFVPSTNGPCSNFEDFAAFRNSAVVVAPHGAGLSNILMCRKGTIVIEIQTRDVNMCYLEVSVKLGLRHVLLFDENAHQGSKITADVNAIVEYLKGQLSTVI